MWMIMFIDEDSYKTIVRNSIIPTCDIICITKDKKILLCLRNNEPLKWIYYIPWWKRYKNEKMVDSAKRKSYEELWLEVDVNRLNFLGVYDDIYDNSAFEWISFHMTNLLKENSPNIDSSMTSHFFCSMMALRK